MNKKAIFALVLVILALLLGYLFFFKKEDSSSPLTSIQSDQSSKPKSIKDLISSGISQRCTFSTEVDQIKSEGTVYTASNKMRGDFSMITDNKIIMNHMIVDGNTSYMWTDGEKNGYKMSFDMSSQSGMESDTSKDLVSSNVNPDVELNYDCGTWIVDSSVFQTPSNVNFMEFNVPTTAPVQQGGSSSNSSSCSYCEGLSGDSKTQCLAALGCK